MICDMALITIVHTIIAPSIAITIYTISTLVTSYVTTILYCRCPLKRHRPSSLAISINIPIPISHIRNNQLCLMGATFTRCKSNTNRYKQKRE